jgi:sugar (pentulose or hexulose) kinase
MSEIFFGIDFATQNSRGVLIDSDNQVLARFFHELAPVVPGADGRLTQDPDSWLVAANYLVEQAIAHAELIGTTIVGMSITATSGTFVLTDLSGSTLMHAAMYNDGRAATPIARAEIMRGEIGGGKTLLAHVPEYVISHLTGTPLKLVSTDWSHAMKTGIDLAKGDWKSEIQETAQALQIHLPSVIAPGANLGICTVGGIPIYAGMTDGCTAQISAGGSTVGSAVTTLGTTLVLKVVADKEVSGPGFYSHRLPASRWLAGAASNLGGISFSKFSADIEQWNEKAAAHGYASHIVYPLVGTGERFPIADSTMRAHHSGEPTSQTDEFRGILEGIAFAERLSYEILGAAGAPSNDQLFTVGGGSKSQLWNSIRAAVMNRTITLIEDAGSDLGAARLAHAAHLGSDIAAQLDSFESSTPKYIHPDKKDAIFYEGRYQEFLSLCKVGTP